MNLIKSAQENIDAPEKAPIAVGKEKDIEEKGEKEKNLEKYMEYVPDKREQEVRLMNMLKDKEKEDEVFIAILEACSMFLNLNIPTIKNTILFYSISYQYVGTK